jgi:hypothetical protein
MGPKSYIAPLRHQRSALWSGVGIALEETGGPSGDTIRRRARVFSSRASTAGGAHYSFVRYIDLTSLIVFGSTATGTLSKRS